MNKQERIDFVEKCIGLAQSIYKKRKSDFNFEELHLLENGGVTIYFNYYDKYGIFENACIELSPEDLECNPKELIAKREAEKQERIKAAKEAEELRMAQHMAEAREAEYKHYLELKAKFDKLN